MGQGNPVPHLGRRPLLTASVTGGFAVAGFALANRMGLIGDHSQSSTSGVLQLSDSADGVRSLEFALGDDVMRPAGPDRWQTAQLPTSTHSMVAITWRRGDPEPEVAISSRREGTWRPFQPLRAMHDLPDESAGEGNGRSGTDLAWIGQADGVRVSLGGARPRDVRLVLLHPSRTSMLGRTMAKRRVTADDLKPVLLTRGDWEADPDWREGQPSYNHTIEQVHVHHTANSNDYSAEDVPGLIRGMYSYHTRSLGWSDIAYNFLVDRFGSTWVGRAGGPGRPVRGAHTLGFNATSTGIAAIGNYDTVRPNDALLAAIAQLAAWKLAPYSRDPKGRITVTSEGSDRYRTGSRPQLPVIDGHRDTNDTACPGRNLYSALPAIRDRTKRLIAGSSNVAITVEPALAGYPVVTKLLRVVAAQTDPPAAVATFTWLRDATAIPGAISATYTATTADVGSQLSVVVTYTASGYEPVQRTLTSSGPVRAVPFITVDALSDRTGTIVTVSVTASGAQSPPTGTVIIALAQRQRSVVMTDGQVRVRFRRGANRTRPVSVRYAGNDEILSGRAEAMVAERGA